jgi:hypothetical protein
MEGKYQNDVDILPDLQLYRYENIFKVHVKGDENFHFYNILKKIKLPEDLNEEVFEFVKYSSALPLTTLSYRIYGTTYLWWLIMIVNNITNPLKIESGTKIRFIKKPFLKIILQSIKEQLQ